MGLSVGDELAGCGQKGRECLRIHASPATAHLDNISPPWCRPPSPALKTSSLSCASYPQVMHSWNARTYAGCKRSCIGIFLLESQERWELRFSVVNRFCHSCKICRIEVVCNTNSAEGNGCAPESLPRIGISAVIEGSIGTSFSPQVHAPN